MVKAIKKCVAACLIASLALPVYAFDDDDLWDGFDASAPTLPPPEPPPYTPPAYEYTPPAETQTYQEPAFTAEPEAPAQPPSYGSVDVDDSYFVPTASRVDAASEGFIRVVRHPIQGESEYRNAVIEGLQVSTDKGTAADEIIVSCYFIFRDRPTSFFYDVNRKDRKLVFEFTDARSGSAPIAALEQAPIKEILIEELQVDANKDIKGLNPEWHDAIRITFDLEHLPIISVTNEHNIIAFSYKWTTNSEKIPEYLDVDKFPMVFWISGGALGGIGLGVLTYFLIPKKEKIISNVLPINDLPGGNNRQR